MSGVNCTRRKSTPIARANAFASSVLATPGTPSSSTCPPTVIAASSTSTTSSCPTTTLRTSRTTRSRSSFTSLSHRRCDSRDDEPAQRERRLVVGRRDARSQRAPLRCSRARSRPGRAAQPSASGGRCAAPRDAIARPLLHRRERVLGIVCAFERDRQRVARTRPGPVAGRARVGRAARSDARATTRTRARRRRAARARPSTRSGARPRPRLRRSRAHPRRTRPAASRSPASAERERGVVGARRDSAFSSGDASARKKMSPSPTCSAVASVVGPSWATSAVRTGVVPRTVARGLDQCGRCRAPARSRGTRRCRRVSNAAAGRAAIVR